MQRWTKNKPNRAGYWWAKNGHQCVVIANIVKIEKTGGPTILAVCYEDNTYEDINDQVYEQMVWGDSPITEPIGEKI